MDCFRQCLSLTPGSITDLEQILQHILLEKSVDKVSTGHGRSISKFLIAVTTEISDEESKLPLPIANWPFRLLCRFHSRFVHAHLLDDASR